MVANSLDITGEGQRFPGFAPAPMYRTLGKEGGHHGPWLNPFSWIACAVFPRVQRLEAKAHANCQSSDSENMCRPACLVARLAGALAK